MHTFYQFKIYTIFVHIGFFSFKSKYNIDHNASLFRNECKCNVEFTFVCYLLVIMILKL